jgi:hypothetical protein
MTDYGKIIVRGGEFYPTEEFIRTPEHDLFRIIMSQTADPELVASLLNFDSVHNRLFGEHPVLHEAVGQAHHYAGARCILETAWNDPRLRSLFDSGDYIDKYGRTVFQRMKESRIPKKEDLCDELYKTWEDSQTPPQPKPAVPSFGLMTPFAVPSFGLMTQPEHCALF